MLCVLHNPLSKLASSVVCEKRRDRFVFLVSLVLPGSRSSFPIRRVFPFHTIVLSLAKSIPSSTLSIGFLMSMMLGVCFWLGAFFSPSNFAPSITYVSD